MVHSEIRVDFMCVVIGNLLLYNYYGTVISQIDITTRLLKRKLAKYYGMFFFQQRLFRWCTKCSGQ